MTSGTLELVVLHRTAARLRVGIQPPDSDDIMALLSRARELRGVRSAEQGASGRNVVLRFDPKLTDSQTMLMRLALTLSARNGYAPVRVMERRLDQPLQGMALTSGAAAVLASALNVVAPQSALAGISGWSAALLTIAAIGQRSLEDLGRGRPRPEMLSLLHLLSRMSGPERGHGALLSWLLFHGGAVVERARGEQTEGKELVPVALQGGVADDSEGSHMEIVTRPVRSRGSVEGSVLSPSKVAAAAIGYLAYLLRAA